MKLPPLPTSIYAGLTDIQSGTVPLYTNYQMEQYGRQCAEAVREECAAKCDSYANDQWALYKGRAPYIGNEKGRADPHVQGASDGASNCADDIRELEVE